MSPLSPRELVPCRTAAAESVERRLRESPFRLRDVCCAFNDGTLVLSGWVGSFYLKQMAQSIALAHAHVPRVDNQLEVRTARPSSN